MSASVAIVGGGITGLCAAHLLLRCGADVTVFESQPVVGGLAATQDFGSFQWDRFYHCILTSDRDLLRMLNEIGLASRLRWRSTKVGFYSQDALHNMTTPADLLRFPCLSLAQKIRFGLGIIYAGRFANGEGLDAVPVKDWVVRVFGAALHREIWDPLLRCKLGEMRSQASAAFLWSTIRRLYSTRGKGIEKKEKLGYVEGGYRVVLDRLSSEISDLGGRFELGAKLDMIEPTREGIGVSGHRAFREYDACLMTVPAPEILRLVPALPSDYARRLTVPQYLGVVCVALVLRHSLSPYYLTNVTQHTPFTGVVEMTNLIDPEIETKGATLVYLPKYTSPADPLFQSSDEQVWENFSAALWRMYPNLRASDIVSRFVFRQRFVQPVPTLHSMAKIPGVATGVPHLFVANTTQIVNDTLNNNAMVRIARNACGVVLDDLKQRIWQGGPPKASSSIPLVAARG